MNRIPVAVFSSSAKAEPLKGKRDFEKAKQLIKEAGLRASE